MEGYVYIGRDDNNRFKIGKSVHPHKREKEIQGMNPSYKMMAYAAVENQTEVEASLHVAFYGKRIAGEWFNLSPEDVEKIFSIGTDFEWVML